LASADSTSADAPFSPPCLFSSTLASSFLICSSYGFSSASLTPAPGFLLLNNCSGFSSEAMTLDNSRYSAV